MACRLIVRAICGIMQGSLLSVKIICTSELCVYKLWLLAKAFSSDILALLGIDLEKHADDAY